MEENNQKAKKEWYKKWWIWLIIVIVLLACISAIGNKKDTSTQQNQQQTQQNQQQTQQSQQQTQQSAASGKMSLEMYNQIQTGMSFDEVVAIVGAQPASQSTMDLLGTTTVMCTWWGEGDVGANALIQFQNGAVSSKSQSGLQ